MRNVFTSAAVLALAAGLGGCGGGSDGKDGAMGETGEAGPAGEPGATGSSGADGTPGEPGAEGAQGLQGAVGPSGADGGTPSEAELLDLIGTALDSRAASEPPGCDLVDVQGDGDPVFRLSNHLKSGQEVEVCKFIQVDEAMNMQYSDMQFSPGSHHAIIWETSYTEIPTVNNDGETVDTTQVFSCPDGPVFEWDTQGVLAGAQGPGNSSEEGAWPDGVVWKLEPGSVLIMDFHMLNASDADIDVCLEWSPHGIPDAEVTNEVGLLFFYDPSITIPANGSSSARAACPITKDITLLDGVSHMHARGTGYRAALLDGDPKNAATTEIQELYATTEWEEPEVLQYDPAIQVTAGHWIDWECQYTNPENRDVSQGTDTTDEMCMFIGAYYPADPTRQLDFCGPAVGNITEGRVYGNGTGSGADFLACFWGQDPRVFGGGGDDPDRYATWACFQDTCEEASHDLYPYLACLGENSAPCQETCMDSQSSFQAVCAITPAAVGGCQEAFGTDGSDGTCAAGAVPDAIPLCTTDAQNNAYTEECETTLCAPAATGDCAANPTGAACTACIGTFTADNPPTSGGGTNDSCLNSLTWACIGNQATTLGTECVTECFTGCITEKVTDCTVDCLNESVCATEFNSIAAATCN